MMINRIFDWYASTNLRRRRVALAVMVPVIDYFMVDPMRWAINSAMKYSASFAIALLPLLLIVGIVAAIATCMFVIEFLNGLVGKIKNRALQLTGIVIVFAWVVLPFYLIKLIGD